MKTYAIGDIQGCQFQLSSLLRFLSESSTITRLIFVGDLINRGPQSLATLRHIRSLGDHAEVVLGNHDLHLLAVSQGIRPLHPTDTLQDILTAPDRDELLDWLRHRPLALFEQGNLLFHAGVLPEWDAPKVMSLAHEVETMLRGPNWVDFLRHMYGNEPIHWDDNLQGYDRLRCIVNTLTRIRFCTPDGGIDFKIKEGAGAAPPGYVPWFDMPGRKTADVTCVFGHWSALGLTLRPNLIGLDTGCVWGGKLTAVRLEDRALFQVDCPQAQRHG
ncbi:symmetrical bis(5'-nucleosyl)-tetraphosphatase [Herbaspirillum sp. RV1423]|uniref:symmetrical bis(5'-nucleosyl)-tetraphosphatase n=1 Tax=Herbaspirillum sp. RV1423 TaxID=1443993 RepID=UPI0009DF1A6A|nr:symmetrical bis(5'-nucleosyl)-tetraphosphatase [Herbaspirillum sp. RV1423]